MPGASHDILDGGAAGALVPPNDPKALADALRSVFANPAALAPQLDRAESRARAVYGMDAMRSTIAAVVRRAVSGPIPC